MKKILLTTIAVAALSQAASAGIEGGKMYAKGDLGYNLSNFKNSVLSVDGSKKLKGFAGDIGFGYALSDSVRTDVTFNFSKGTGKNSVESFTGELSYTPDTKAGSRELISIDSAKAASVSMTEKSTALMANAYYDFSNSSGFTPYLMAGLGVNRGKEDLKFSGKDSDDSDVSFTIKSNTKTTLAYQVGVGVGYEMAKDIHIDLAYKLFRHASKYNYKFKGNEAFRRDAIVYNKDSKTPYSTEVINSTTKSKKSIMNHTLTAGVRFAF